MPALFYKYNQKLLMKLPDETLVRLIAITQIPGIGHTNAKRLLSWIEDPGEIFQDPKGLILKVPGLRKILSTGVDFRKLLDRARAELEFIKNSGIEVLYFYSDDYPGRLKHCADSPLLLYYKGTDCFRHKRMLAVVGTRNATAYGKKICDELISDFSRDDVLVISGMAYGIDSCAHRAALAAGLDTLGVMAHGLDMIYPGANRNIAKKMLEQGGLITEFMSGTTPDRENFPKRNRIIAGLADAVLVVESATKGGAVITANIANSYNRDVFAIPGRTGDEFSDGCHLLIRRNIAALVRSAADIRYSMGWEGPEAKKENHEELLSRFSGDEQKILRIILDKERAPLDDILILSGIGASRSASILLKLEFEGIIAGLPGKIYSLRK